MPSISLTKNPVNQRIKSRQPSLLKKVFFSVNWLLLLVVAGLVSLGLVVVYSASYGNPDYSFSRQFMGVGLGCLAMLLFWAFDYQLLARLTIPIYILAILLAISPLIPGLGVEVNGARNWINVFGQQIQPGEFAKLLIIIAMAALVARYRGKLQSGKDYLFCLGVMLLPVLCVVLQPDLGTGLVFLAIGLTMLFVGGANRWWLALTMICGALAIVGILAADPLLDNLVGHDVLIKEYQINRLLVFMNEDLDPAGLGYNLRQAKIAIGSAGFRGAGFMQGTQSSLGFLPEAPTDFIFCVLAEEFGFLGSLVLISLYTLLVLISLRAALKADAFGALLIGGGLGMWVFQILENIGMTCGMMPITGIPLPFMSYGSSFMMINFCMVGLIMSVSMRSAWQAMQKPAIDPVAIDRAASERRW